MPEEIPWWWTAVAVPVGIAIWTFLTKTVIPWFFANRTDTREHHQQLELSDKQIEQQARLQHLNSGAYASQMLTQALSEAQIEGHDANQWIRTILADLLRTNIEAQNRRDKTMEDHINAILRTLLDLGDSQKNILKALETQDNNDG